VAYHCEKFRAILARVVKIWPIYCPIHYKLTFDFQSRSAVACFRTPSVSDYSRQIATNHLHCFVINQKRWNTESGTYNNITCSILFCERRASVVCSVFMLHSVTRPSKSVIINLGKNHEQWYARWSERNRIFIYEQLLVACECLILVVASRDPLVASILFVRLVMAWRLCWCIHIL